MLKHLYEAELRFDMSTISPSVKSVMEGVNEMFTAVTGQTAKVMSGPVAVEVTTTRKLDSEEEAKLLSAMQEAVKENGSTISNLVYRGVISVPTNEKRGKDFYPLTKRPVRVRP